MTMRHGVLLQREGERAFDGRTANQEALGRHAV
jgi:hypothetical protein